MANDLRQPINGLRAECGGIAGNVGFARLFNAGHSPVQGRDQFLELTREHRRDHGHREGPRDGFPRREAFQISPHPLHRQ